MLLCAVVLLTTATSCVCAVRPGFKARITQHALDYGPAWLDVSTHGSIARVVVVSAVKAQLQTSWLMSQAGLASQTQDWNSLEMLTTAANQQAIDAVATLVSKASIPDQSGSSGGVDYSLTNIHITGFTKPSSSIKLVPSVGLSWSAANAGIRLHADWRVKYKKGWFKVSTSGSVDVSASGVSFSLTMALGDDSTGRPSIKSGGCSCSVDGVDIDIHGDIAFFLSLFKHEIEKRVRALIPGKLCDAVNDEVNNKAESQLKKLKVVTSLLDKKFMLDYRLVSVPTFQSAYMETFHKGEITWQADPQAPPFAPQPLPPYPSASVMLYLWVGQYVPQSFIYAAQHHGFLQYNLTTKDLPPDQRGFLNTTCTSLTCVGNLVPAIGKKYPGCTVELRMNSTAMPQVNMAPGQLGAWFAGDIAFYAHTQQGETPYLLTLNVSAMFNMTATIANQLVVGNISGSSFKVDVVKSAVGPLKSKAINTMVGLTLKFFVIPKLNEKGNSGFPLPVSDDVKFVNTQLQIQQDALMIGTDLEYQFH